MVEFCSLTVVSKVVIWSVYVFTLVVSSLIWVDSFVISGCPSSSRRLSLISMVVTVVFVFFTISKIALRVGWSSASAAMFSFDVAVVDSGLFFADLAPNRVLGMLLFRAKGSLMFHVLNYIILVV